MTTNLSPLRFALAWPFLLSLSFSAACGGGVARSGDPPLPVEDSHTVRDPDTGTPLVDAEVTGGPLGRPDALALWDSPYMAEPLYGAEVAGYERAWEFSIVRGRDYLRHVVLVGPSYPSLTVSRENEG